MKDYDEYYGCMGYMPFDNFKKNVNQDGYMEFASESDYKEQYNAWLHSDPDE